MPDDKPVLLLDIYSILIDVDFVHVAPLTATQLEPLFFCKVWVAVMLFTLSLVARLMQVAVEPDIDNSDMQFSLTKFSTDTSLSSLPVSAYDVIDIETHNTAAVIAEINFLIFNVFTSLILISSSFIKQIV